MNTFYSFEDLKTEAQCGGKRESTPRLRSAQFRQILSLQLHHDIVEAIVTPTADETTHVILT